MNQNYIYLIPLYNKSPVLEETINQLEKIENKKVFFIENGSTDDSLEKCKKLIGDKKDFKILISKKGFGNALSKGLSEIQNAQSGILVITGADLPFGFSDINYLKEELNFKFEVCIGSKAHKDSIIKRSLVRSISSKVFNIFIKILFRLRIKDTQGSILLNLQRVSISNIKIYSEYFFSSVELIIKLRRKKYLVKEIPIEIKGNKNNATTVNVFSDSLVMLSEMLRFKFYVKD
jgi:glycosyltransferase involved in cell wall biosynthesis